MKKIRNASELQGEKNFLRLRELEAKEAIFKDWKELGDQFQSKNILKNNSPAHSKYPSILKFILRTVHFLTGKILHETGEKQLTNPGKKIRSNGWFTRFFTK